MKGIYENRSKGKERIYGNFLLIVVLWDRRVVNFNFLKIGKNYYENGRDKNGVNI